MSNFIPSLKRKMPRMASLWHYVSGLPLRRRTPEEIFADIYRRNYWGDATSRSGVGSNLLQTDTIRRALPVLLRDLDCGSILDAPCGDFFWMSSVPLEGNYTGCDIVPELVEENEKQYGAPNRRFLTRNILQDPLPEADLVLCRDCLVHFSYADILRALRNIRASGATYLLTTTFTELPRNWNIATGSWRPLNLQAPPFRFPEPMRLLNEQCTESEGGFTDKCLGLWRVADLPIA